MLPLIIYSLRGNPFQFIVFAVGDWMCIEAWKALLAKPCTKFPWASAAVVSLHFNNPIDQLRIIDLRVAQQLPPKLAHSQSVRDVIYLYLLTSESLMNSSIPSVHGRGCGLNLSRTCAPDTWVNPARPEFAWPSKIISLLGCLGESSGRAYA
jgi:hypothetical protein